MIKAVIIEDEQLAAERLQLLLKRHEDVQVIKHLYSIEDSVLWLKENRHPDLLFLDIHLADGFCFEIFKEIAYKKPVIFITAYDQYAMEAFSLFSIDYLLKPVTAEMLARAMHKFDQFKNSFSIVDYQKLANAFQQSQYKSRFMARSGQK